MAFFDSFVMFFRFLTEIHFRKIIEDFQWIWVDILHVDSHLYLYYLQAISSRQVLVVVQDSAHPPYIYASKENDIGMSQENPLID